ncbi:MAG: hypothetical protein LBB48_02230 [Treponema sp.]|jgi:uncharacterized protein (UPF0305 family)|nr:hypothetical protein [Treponema sp.]
MSNTIFHSEINGSRAICFDTGLNEQDFARAGLSRLLMQRGIVVRNIGNGAEKIETWKCESIVKQNESMVVWGADFTDGAASRAFDELLADDNHKDVALDALRRWIKARAMIRDDPASPSVSLAPGGTFIDEKGTLFFPPALLAERCFEAENAVLEKKERFVHPDLEGKAADAWTLACMAYRIFCDADAFQAKDIITIRQDMREGVFFPPRFAKPGVDRQFDALIKRAFSKSHTDHPTLEKWRQFLEENDTSNKMKRFDSFFHALTPEEAEKVEREKNYFIKSHSFSVKTRRFLTKNSAIVLGVTIAVVIGGLLIGSVVYDRSNAPNTEGMTPAEVVQAYYTAFTALDHEFMQNAVLKKAGKADIDVAVRLYALDRVRQAYQINAVQRQSSIIKAQDWLDSGGQPVIGEYFVFGVTDLQATPEDQDESDGEVSFRVRYNLWATDHGDTEAQPQTALMPSVQARIDELRLVLYKGNWCIAEVKRAQG